MRKFLLSLIILIAAFSCNQQKAKDTKQKNTDKHLVGKYVYYDKASILHTESGCKSVYKVPTIGTRPVSAVEVDRLWDIDLKNICSQCVTPEQLDYLVNVAKKNYESGEVVDTTILGDVFDLSVYDRRRSLYDNLTKDGFDLGTWENFNRNIRISRLRRSLYDAAVEADWDLPEYEQFCKDLGF